MPIVSMPEILRPAFQQRYGVGAFNIFNDLTMDAVLAAAAELHAPVIVQVSLKTVKVMGARLIQAQFAEMAARINIPATLHLDHCPDVTVIRECLEAGWNSVLFDGSQLDYESNLKQTREIVTLACRYGAAVEGEIEAVRGVEDGIGSDTESVTVTADRVVRFIHETGVGSFAPAIGTAHGVYKKEPEINYAKLSDIVSLAPIPMVLHGGTGLSPEVFRELIARGAVKVNISTQLKITFLETMRKQLNAVPTVSEPLKVLAATREAVKQMAMKYIRIFGSEGKAHA